jgi:hypothetical protein
LRAEYVGRTLLSAAFDFALEFAFSGLSGSLPGMIS